MDAITSYRLRFLGLDAPTLESEPLPERLRTAYEAFIREMPFENLSHQRSCLGSPDAPASWPRGTDRVLRDHKHAGLGGTCFSLAYALRDVLQGVGGNAHLVLGRNLVSEEPHAAVLVFRDGDVYLFDAALLAKEPVRLEDGVVVEDPLGTVRVKDAGCGCRTVEVRKQGEMRSRPVLSVRVRPAHPSRYRSAWIGTFERGRRRPLRLARRVGDVIHRYVETPGRLESLTPWGTERHDLDDAPAAELHALFGIGEDYLREWFRA